MNNILINSNDNNNQTPKPSRKKTVLKWVLVALVIWTTISTVVQLFTANASADDISLVMNGYTTLSFEPTDSTIVAEGTEVGTIGECTMVPYVEIEYNSDNDNVIFIMNNITVPYRDVYYNVFISYVIKANNESNTGYQPFTLAYNLNNTDYVTNYYESYITKDYTIISYQIEGNWSRNNVYSYFALQGLGSAGINNTYDVLCCFIGYDAYDVAKNAVARCEYENQILNPPTNVVYDTDQIVKTIYNTHTNYQPQDLMIPWNNFYLGFICSAVIEGTTVDLIYSVAYEDYQYGRGTIVILDDAYHDYILEVDLDGAVTYGQIELDIENNGNEFDVKYIAVSDNNV